jgi:hypothetical protein
MNLLDLSNILDVLEYSVCQKPVVFCGKTNGEKNQSPSDIVCKGWSITLHAPSNNSPPFTNAADSGGSATSGAAVGTSWYSTRHIASLYSGQMKRMIVPLPPDCSGMDGDTTLPVRIAPECPSHYAQTTRTTKVAARLIDVVRMQQWEFLSANPTLITRQSAKYHDAEGLYPLHWAVAGRAPLAVVQTLVDAYPKAICRSTREGESVLHLATQYQSKEAEGVVGYILECYPQAAHQLDQYGHSPIFHAVLTQPLSVLKELVWAAPAMMTSSTPSEPTEVPIRRNRTPLYRLWAKAKTDPTQTQPPSGETWDKAVWLLLAAHQHAMDTNVAGEPANAFHEDASVDLKQVIHAAIQMSACLPDDILNILVTAFPEHLRVSNALGQWPLSAALTLPTDNGYRRYSSTKVSLLLRAEPEAAKNVGTSTGRCALFEAIASGHSWRGLESDSSHLVTLGEVWNLTHRHPPDRSQRKTRVCCKCCFRLLRT